MKHTPRPWQIEKGNLTSAWFIHHSGAEICMLPNHTLHQEPNARLIAAAPDLFEACEEVVRYFETKPGALSDGEGAIVKLLKESLTKANDIEPYSEGSMGEEGLVERRKEKRFQIEKPLFAVVGEPFPRQGEITDISTGGLALKYSANESLLNGLSELDIFLVQSGSGITKIKRLRVDPKWEVKMYGKMRKQGVQFRRLNHKQRSQLTSIVDQFSMHEVESSERK